MSKLTPAHKEQLRDFEIKLEAELAEKAKSDRNWQEPADSAALKGAKHEPIYDGTVDLEEYLSSPLKILWILKEARDNKEGVAGGGWSVTKCIIPRDIATGKISWLHARMACITYSVRNNYVPWSEKWGADSKVPESLKSIAYINVSKLPGRSKSYYAYIKYCYEKNRDILRSQINAYDPDIVICGNVLNLFFSDFGLNNQDLQPQGSAAFSFKNGRLYINAFHPSYRRIKNGPYVNDIVAIIKNNSANFHPRQSAIR